MSSPGFLEHYAKTCCQLVYTCCVHVALLPCTSYVILVSFLCPSCTPLVPQRFGVVVGCLGRPYQVLWCANKSDIRGDRGGSKLRGREKNILLSRSHAWIVWFTHSGSQGGMGGSRCEPDSPFASYGSVISIDANGPRWCERTKREPCSSLSIFVPRIGSCKNYMMLTE